jgi:hypothetical protein
MALFGETAFRLGSNPFEGHREGGIYTAIPSVIIRGWAQPRCGARTATRTEESIWLWNSTAPLR